MNPTQNPPTPVAFTAEITRARLRDQTMLALIRANPPAGLTLRTDADLEGSLNRVLHEHDHASDVHVFGYGSLMWNPAFEFTQVQPARVHGWHRSFCLRTCSAGAPQASQA